MVVWYVWLFSLRFFEWLLVIGVFHERKAAERKPLRLCRLSMLGTIWSFILDVTAAIVVMVTPGAFMIIC